MRNGLKMCVLSLWLTTLCALRIALTEWDGLVLCKHIGWRHWKMLRLLKPISSCSRNKNLFDSINIGVLKVPSCLFLIFCWFHVNKGDIISPSSCVTRVNVRDLFIATTAKHVPRDWYASVISILKFSNSNLDIFFLWFMPRQQVPKSKSEWILHYI